VDDEEPIRKALSRLIRSAGMEVETFPSGAELLESFSARRPDCIVLDLHMPAVNGFEVPNPDGGVQHKRPSNNHYWPRLR
jgi:FixJ family two-component response regulator